MIEPARRRRVSCAQENKLFTPPPSTSKRWQKPFKPRFGEGGRLESESEEVEEEESPVTRQPLCHLPRHAKISHLPLEAAFTRYTAAFFFFLKASSAGLTWQNKAGTELNDVALGKKVWCDYIAFFPPCVMEGRELCCSKDAELYFKKEMAVSSATAGGESLLCLFFFFFKYLTCWLFFFMTGRNEQRPIRLHV